MEPKQTLESHPPNSHIVSSQRLAVCALKQRLGIEPWTGVFDQYMDGGGAGVTAALGSLGSTWRAEEEDEEPDVLACAFEEPCVVLLLLPWTLLEEPGTRITLGAVTSVLCAALTAVELLAVVVVDLVGVLRLLSGVSATTGGLAWVAAAGICRSFCELAGASSRRGCEAGEEEDEDDAAEGIGDLNDDCGG